MKKSMLREAVKSLVLNTMITFGKKKNNSFVVVYHDISPTSQIKPVDFEKQIKFWLKNGFEFVSEVEELKNPKRIILTFDDAYASFEECVFPLLKKYKLPAVLFIPTDYLGKKFNDGISKKEYQDKKIISTASLKRMHKSKLVTLGCHTHRHLTLPDKNENFVKNEIEKSTQTIRSITKKSCNHFCYPLGKINAATKSIVKRAGFSYAFGLEPKSFGNQTDRLKIPRLDGNQFLSNDQLKLSMNTTLNLYFFLVELLQIKKVEPVKLLVNHFINPLFWEKIKRTQRFDMLKYLKKRQWDSMEQNKKEQAEKLYNLIKHTHNNVPYYQKIIQENKIKYSKKTIFEDIKKIPVLTQDNIKKNFETLKSKDKNYKKRNPFIAYSGGSTGRPKKFVMDKIVGMQCSAGMDLFQNWAGRDEGDYAIKLWGDASLVKKFRERLRNLILRYMTNTELVTAFDMTPKNMLNYVKKINKKRPKIIIAYVENIYELAKFIRKKNLKVHSPKGIITGSGTLFPHMKQEIEDVFCCNVFNQYGSREASAIGCSCEKQKEIHINTFNYYLEILDNNFQQVKPGETGKIHITTLDNYSMPLIRYDIGDFGTEAKYKQCRCGRGWPLITNIEGREMSMFKTKKGKVIPALFFIHHLGVLLNKEFITKYQIIQNDYDNITIKLVLTNQQKFEESKEELRSIVKKVMGKKCKVHFELVNDIKSLKNGKYLYTISKVKEE